jgi:uncharacterized damage-inducible protein DinB
MPERPHLCAPAGQGAKKMKRILSGAFVLALILGGAFRAQAQAPADAKPAAAPAVQNIRTAFLDDLKEEQEKIVGLAEAFPADKFTWRPAGDVRSVSETLLHLATANFGFPNAWGVKPPEGLDLRGLATSTTDKAKVIAVVKQSYDHMRTAVSNLSDADLEKRVKFFGDDATIADILFHTANHQHEHLGQLIAYARMNGVVPPWTAARAAKPAH